MLQKELMHPMQEKEAFVFVYNSLEIKTLCKWYTYARPIESIHFDCFHAGVIWRFSSGISVSPLEHCRRIK